MAALRFRFVENLNCAGYFICTFDTGQENSGSMLSDSAMKKQIKQVVVETDATAVAILFGSRARGTAKGDSDWDVLILVDKPTVTIVDEQAFRHKLYDLELRTGNPISTFVYSAYDWSHRLPGTSLKSNVQKDGIVL
jgi:predicted nucleotidyltransferase